MWSGLQSKGTWHFHFQINIKQWILLSKLPFGTNMGKTVLNQELKFALQSQKKDKN